MCSRSRFVRVAVVCGVLAAAPAVFADAAGKLSDGAQSLSYSGGPYLLPNLTPQTAGLAGGEPTCEAGTPTCDVYTLSVDLSDTFRAANAAAALDIEIQWPEPAADYDVYFYDAQGDRIADAASSADPEFISVPLEVLPNGSYKLVVIPFLPLAQSFTGNIQVSGVEAATASSAKAVTLGGPVFDVFNPADAHKSEHADEPTLAAVARSDANPDDVLMSYGTRTLRTEFDDSTSPATTKWSNVTDLANKAVNTTTDPILYGNEHISGKPARVWTSELAQSTALIAFTDDAGASWKFSTGNAPAVAADHQAVAAGPYPAGSLIAHPLYEHAVYYCSQAIANAFCTRSDDGGLTWGPSIAIYPVTGLCGLHGHVKVGGDGTVYVPIKSCGGAEGVAVSSDAGLNWGWAEIPRARVGRWDPSIAIANDGKTVYIGYGEEGKDHPLVLKGLLNKSNALKPTIDWDARGAVDVGVPAGLNNIVFNTVIAGDPDRAAYAFHGTTVKGDSGSDKLMAKAVWHLYVATTYDGGANWQLRQIQSDDPTQKRAICDKGINCPANPPNRNLLDFMDMVIDGKGRIMVGYADGCIGPCLKPNGPATYSDRGAIARQVGGKPLLAKFDSDPAFAAKARAPSVDGTRTLRGLELSWKAPYDGGAKIEGYDVERLDSRGALQTFRIGPKPFFLDPTAKTAGETYTYRVRALNALGVGELSAPVALASAAPAKDAPVTESACTPPGITVVTDGNGDPLTGPAEAMQPFEDIEWIAFAEPGELASKLAITLKVASLPSALPPQYRWVTYFKTNADTAQEKEWFVAMTTADGPTPKFTYGYTAYLNTPAATIGEFDTQGELDGYVEDGRIVIVFDQTLAEGLAPGALISNIYAKVRRSSPDDLGGYGLTIDDTSTGAYEVVGNASCKPKYGPVAKAQASAHSGAAPFTVTVDASPSEDLAGKGIDHFVFNFGDGTVVNSQDGVLSHTYQETGAYRTTVTAYNLDGTESYNRAKLTFLVGQNQTDSGALNEKDGYSIFAGAFGLVLLLPLGGLAALRRRLH